MRVGAFKGSPAGISMPGLPDTRRGGRGRVQRLPEQAGLVRVQSQKRALFDPELQHPLLITCVSLKASELFQAMQTTFLHEVVEKTQLSHMNAIACRCLTIHHTSMTTSCRTSASQFTRSTLRSLRL